MFNKLKEKAKEAQARSISNVIKLDGMKGETNLSKKALLKFANSEDAFERKIAAQDYNAPEEVLVKLSTDEAEGVQLAVLSKPNVTASILEKSLEKADFITRYTIIANPKFPKDKLIALSMDTDSAIRAAVAENPNTPFDVLSKLSNDEVLGVSLKAKRNLEKR